MGVLTSSQIVLEWSADPLSDTTPTYVTVNNTEIRSLEWWAGIDREGNDPEPGGMVVVLKNVARKWEPLFGSNTIDTQQRFRLTVAGVAEGVFYSQDFDIDWPSGQEYSEVTITCGDGFDVLAQDDLPGLDPPDAASYADVVAFDEPWGYWRLGEPEGTKVVAHVRVTKRWRGKGKKRRKVTRRRRWDTIETAADSAGAAGPAGVYKNTPTLAQAGLILGDRDTSVLFTAASSEYVEIEVDDDSFHTGDAVTMEAWVSSTFTATTPIIGGPILSGSDNSAFYLLVNSDNSVTAAGVASISTSAGVITDGQPNHIAAVQTNGLQEIYVNGVLAAQSFIGGTIDAFAASPRLYVGRYRTAATWVYGTFTGDEVAVYEGALSAARVLARYQAGAERGYAEQTAGERIAAIATHALWSEAEIQTAGLDVQPVMQSGQPKLEEIAEAAHAEGPLTLFFFNGDGNPVYLGSEFQATAAEYNTTQATFNDGGTGTPYNSVEINYDSEVYNEILASHESGESVTAVDAASQSKRGPRRRTEETDVLLMLHNDVEFLANHVLDLYRQPAMRPYSLTIDGHHALTQIKTLDLGHQVRVQKAGVTGDPIDRITHIIGKRKSIDGNRLYTCTYTIGRGFDANSDDWVLGVGGLSELGQTTVLA